MILFVRLLVNYQSILHVSNATHTRARAHGIWISYRSLRTGTAEKMSSLSIPGSLNSTEPDRRRRPGPLLSSLYLATWPPHCCLRFQRLYHMLQSGVRVPWFS